MKFQKPDHLATKTKWLGLLAELSQPQIDNLTTLVGAKTFSVQRPQNGRYKMKIRITQGVANLVHTRLGNWRILWENV